MNIVIIAIIIIFIIPLSRFISKTNIVHLTSWNKWTITEFITFANSIS